VKRRPQGVLSFEGRSRRRNRKAISVFVATIPGRVIQKGHLDQLSVRGGVWAIEGQG